MTRRAILIAVAISASTIAISALALTTGKTPSFHRDEWIAGGWRPSMWHFPRRSMADDLVNSRLLIGRSRMDVETMLGAPSSTDKFRDADLVYWIGPDRGMFGIDNEWLIVSFDSRGIVDNYFITAD